jgi:hypothetical protein
VIGRAKLAATYQPGVQPAVEARHNFAGEIALLGYDLPAEAGPGDALPLTLYWQSLARPTQDYTVFVHLLDEQGNLVAQSDAPPRAGGYPTSLWTPSEVITDRHTVLLPSSLPAERYQLHVGLYAPSNGSRLSVLDTGGQVLSDHATILDLYFAH